MNEILGLHLLLNDVGTVHVFSLENRKNVISFSTGVAWLVKYRE